MCGSRPLPDAVTRSTGAGAVVNLAPEDHDLEGPNRHRLRSCGVAGPGVELKIVDPESRAELPIGDVGEIWIRSPQVMRGERT